MFNADAWRKTQRRINETQRRLDEAAKLAAPVSDNADKWGAPFFALGWFPIVFFAFAAVSSLFASNFAAMRLALASLVAAVVITYVRRGIIFSGFSFSRLVEMGQAKREMRQAKREPRRIALAGVEWGAIFWGLFVWFAIHVPWFFALFIGLVLGLIAFRRALAY